MAPFELSDQHRGRSTGPHSLTPTIFQGYAQHEPRSSDQSVADGGQAHDTQVMRASIEQTKLRVEMIEKRLDENTDTPSHQSRLTTLEDMLEQHILRTHPHMDDEAVIRKYSATIVQVVQQATLDFHGPLVEKLRYEYVLQKLASLDAKVLATAEKCQSIGRRMEECSHEQQTNTQTLQLQLQEMQHENAKFVPSCKATEYSVIRMVSDEFSRQIRHLAEDLNVLKSCRLHDAQRVTSATGYMFKKITDLQDLRLLDNTGLRVEFAGALAAMREQHARVTRDLEDEIDEIVYQLAFPGSNTLNKDDTDSLRESHEASMKRKRAKSLLPTCSSTNPSDLVHALDGRGIDSSAVPTLVRTFSWFSKTLSLSNGANFLRDLLRRRDSESSQTNRKEICSRSLTSVPQPKKPTRFAGALDVKPTTVRTLATSAKTAEESEQMSSEDKTPGRRFETPQRTVTAQIAPEGTGSDGEIKPPGVNTWNAATSSEPTLENAEQRCPQDPKQRNSEHSPAMATRIQTNVTPVDEDAISPRSLPPEPIPIARQPNHD